MERQGQLLGVGGGPTLAQWLMCVMNGTPGGAGVYQATYVCSAAQFFIFFTPKALLDNCPFLKNDR